ncbi:hypothetical protein [Flexithrix dorotheae]|uniref:hypothetical protein n=1 Tax=Flexithrix dorotheae TaxID=70993 RepID=UPI00037AF5FF|nr:hypothetical protein [Flexithrix dorotheae]
MKNLYFAIGLIFFITSCSSSGDFHKSPIDELIKKMDSEKNFTIILYDMDVEGAFLSDTYKHQYKIIKEKADSTQTPYEEITDWYIVDENTFARYENDMGMEVASKNDGVVTKQTAPPGYSRYVGNEKYGHWQTNSSGQSFWSFYGQYAFMSSMMGLMAGPVYRTSYYDYRDNYRGVRPYYGGVTSAGTTRYGTLSDVSRKQNPNFHRRANTNSALKSRVNNSIARSSGGRTSNSKTSRSDSRYSSSSSSRSRSFSSGGK